MSTLTLCCFVDAPATLLDLLTAEFSDCRVRLATTAPTVSACLEQLVANGDQVALAIVAEGWLTMPELQAFYDQFPQALTVVLAAPEAIDRGSVGPRPIYRCLAYPGPEAELVFTVSAALALPQGLLGLDAIAHDRYPPVELQGQGCQLHLHGV